jgi:hypothetical protein
MWLKRPSKHETLSSNPIPPYPKRKKTSPIKGQKSEETKNTE